MTDNRWNESSCVFGRDVRAGLAQLRAWLRVRLRCRARLHSRARLWHGALSLALLLGLTGCEVMRVYKGAAIRTDPSTIVVGETGVAEVLSLFGPPMRIQRQLGGEVFIYRYTRMDSRKLMIEEPVITNTELYSYTVVREDSEMLVVLFDRNDIVRGVGYRNGAEALDR